MASEVELNFLFIFFFHFSSSVMKSVNNYVNCSRSPVNMLLQRYMSETKILTCKSKNIHSLQLEALQIL